MNLPIEINPLKFSNMHIQSCFIRKNTSELFSKLKDIGCKISNFNPKNKHDGILFNRYIAFSIAESDYDYIINEYKKYNKSIIDCNTNEDLFLALVALRDDCDKYQWITNGKDFELWELDEPFLSYYSRCEYIKALNIFNIIFPHKASVKELIEYFNQTNNESVY